MDGRFSDIGSKFHHTNPNDNNTVFFRFSFFFGLKELVVDRSTKTDVVQIENIFYKSLSISICKCKCSSSSGGGGGSSFYLSLLHSKSVGFRIEIIIRTILRNNKMFRIKNTSIKLTCL